MAADVKAPRFNRSTTNMQDASAAMLARAEAPNPDAELIQRGERWSGALALYNTPRDYGDGEKEHGWFETFCQEEQKICEATAQTPQGLEVQLWALLENLTESEDDGRAVAIGNLAHFTRAESRYDWHPRLVIAALRSVRAMQGAAA